MPDDIVSIKDALDSRQLSAFVTLARTGSFTETGKLHFLTQSAVSHSIKALERDTGCRLFSKLGKKILLTQSGELLLMHAEKILGEMKQARSRLRQLSKWGGSRVRMGAAPSVCQYILPLALAQFAKSFPRAEIAAEPGDTGHLMSLLEENMIDFAFCIQPAAHPQFEFNPVFADELMFIVSATHPWALKQKVNRDDIATQKYVLLPRTSSTFPLIEKFFAEEEIVLNLFIQIGNVAAIKELVRRGAGISILPAWVADREIQEGSLMALPLGKRKLQRQWGAMHRRRYRLSLPDEKLIQLCRDAALSLGLQAK